MIQAINSLIMNVLLLCNNVLAYALLTSDPGSVNVNGSALPTPFCKISIISSNKSLHAVTLALSAATSVATSVLRYVIAATVSVN